MQFNQSLMKSEIGAELAAVRLVEAAVSLYLHGPMFIGKVALRACALCCEAECEWLVELDDDEYEEPMETNERTKALIELATDALGSCGDPVHALGVEEDVSCLMGQLRTLAIELKIDFEKAVDDAWTHYKSLG